MEERKYKVAWEREVIARDMRLNDALLFIEALCNKYHNNHIEITLLDSKAPEEATYNAE
jgi:hypothetical protein